MASSEPKRSRLIAQLSWRGIRGFPKTDGARTDSGNPADPGAPGEGMAAHVG